MKTQLPLAELFRQSVYRRVAGHADVNDAERLPQDPAFRLIGSEKISRPRSAPNFAVAIVRDRDAPAEENFAGLPRMNAN